MSLLYSLCSSSKGNCHFVGTPQEGLLIDGGIGIRNYAAQLALAGISLEAPKAVLATPEHSVHVSGLQKIVLRHHLPVYGTPGTLDALVQKGILDYSLDLRVIQPGETVSLGSQSFTAVSTPHDSAQSCCYRVEQADQTMMVCTDLGQITSQIHDALLGCHTVLLESNYDEEMMAHSPYPYFLRRRIVGGRGHLSNTDCAKELVELAKAGTKRFVLGHLSQENNRPELAYQNALTALLEAGAVPGEDFTLWVAPRMNSGRVVAREEQLCTECG